MGGVQNNNAMILAPRRLPGLPPPPPLVRQFTMRDGFPNPDVLPENERVYNSRVPLTRWPPFEIEKEIGENNDSDSDIE